MTAVVPTLALAGLLALGGPAYGGAAPDQGAGPSRPSVGVEPDTLFGPGPAVPYVAQGRLLCGGASAAMVQRYWGELGVYAEDYEPLVDVEAGGIHTDALAAAIESRGYRTRVARDSAAVGARLRDGAPVIALLRSGAARYHYVVITAVEPGRVHYHDPLIGPGRTLDRDAFVARWAASGYWSLTAVPAPGMDAPAQDAPAESGDSGPDADRPLPTALDSALGALRAGRADSAAPIIERWLGGAPADHPRLDLAREILATARYLTGDTEGALRAWNPEGPPVDLVRVRGLRVMRWRTAADPMGVEPGDVLTPAALRLARRRLVQLPAVALGDVGYTPLRNGAVQLEAVLVERRPVPASIPELAAIGVGAAVNEQVEVGLGPFLGVGERCRVAGSWEGARPLLAVQAAVPWRPAAGVVTVEGGRLEERFVTDAVTERTWGAATFRRWVSASALAGVTVGLERWDAGPRTGRVGLSILTGARDGVVQLGAAVDGWWRPGASAADAGDRTGADRVARLRAGTRLRVESIGYTGRAAVGEPAPHAGRAWTMTVGGSLASTGAPATLWDGAGTGRVRAPLLRGHPLVRGDRIGEAAFGRGIAHASAGHEWFIRAGPAEAALGLFLDGARVWAPFVGSARTYIDPGIELAVRAPGRVAAISLARGERWTLSVRVQTDGLPWLAGPVW